MNYNFIAAQEFAHQRKNTEVKNLYGGYWRESSLALLLAQKGTGKTGLAVRIAAAIGQQGGQVLYIDADECLDRHVMSALATARNLYIYRASAEDIDAAGSYADAVLNAMECAITEHGFKTLVVDSISAIAAMSFGRSGSVVYIMKRIAAMQRRYGVNILVLAHETSKSATKALSMLADSTFTPEDEAPLLVEAPEAEAAITPTPEPTPTPMPAPVYAPEPIIIDLDNPTQCASISRTQRREMMRAARRAARKQG